MSKSFNRQISRESNTGNIKLKADFIWFCSQNEPSANNHHVSERRGEQIFHERPPHKDKQNEVQSSNGEMPMETIEEISTCQEDVMLAQK